MPKKESGFQYQVFFKVEGEGCEKCKGQQHYYFDEIPKRPHPNCNCDIMPISKNHNAPKLGKAEIKTKEEVEKIELKTFEKENPCVKYSVNKTLKLIKKIPKNIEEYAEEIGPENFQGGMNHYKQEVLTEVKKGQITKIFLVVKYRIITIKVPVIIEFTEDGEVIKSYIEKYIEGEIKVPLSASCKIKKIKKK